MEAKVSEDKKAVVKEFVDLFNQYPIVAAVNMENLPAKQLQNMRSQLREKVVMKMTKRRLIKIALEEAKKTKAGIEQIEEHLRGMPALIFTKENPFSLYKNIQKNKSSAPAKAGQTAPNDIIVKAGPTSFAPGPVIGELGAIGIKAGVDAGKIAIKEDAVVVKDGEVISAEVAAMLSRLGLEPMQIGLDVTAVYEDGSIFKKDILAVDEEEYINNITQCASWAFNLSIESGIINSDTTDFLLQKAFRDSKAVALESKFLADAVADELVEQAEREMLGLKSQLNLEVDKAQKEEPKVEEKPAEEAKAEETTEEKGKEAPAEKAEEEKPKEEEKVEETKPEETTEKPAAESKPEEKTEEAPAEQAEEPKAEATEEKKEEES